MDYGNHIAEILRSWAQQDTPSGAYEGRLLTPRGHAEFKGAAEIDRLRTFIKTVHQTLWDGDVKGA